MAKVPLLSWTRQDTLWDSGFWPQTRGPLRLTATLASGLSATGRGRHRVLRRSIPACGAFTDHLWARGPGLASSSRRCGRIPERTVCSVPGRASSQRILHEDTWGRFPALRSRLRLHFKMCFKLTLMLIEGARVSGKSHTVRAALGDCHPGGHTRGTSAWAKSRDAARPPESPSVPALPRSHIHPCQGLPCCPPSPCLSSHRVLQHGRLCARPLWSLLCLWVCGCGLFELVVHMFMFTSLFRHRWAFG